MSELRTAQKQARKLRRESLNNAHIGLHMLNAGIAELRGDSATAANELRGD